MPILLDSLFHFHQARLHVPDFYDMAPSAVAPSQVPMPVRSDKVISPPSTPRHEEEMPSQLQHLSFGPNALSGEESFLPRIPVHVLNRRLMPFQGSHRSLPFSPTVSTLLCTWLLCSVTGPESGSRRAFLVTSACVTPSIRDVSG